MLVEELQLLVDGFETGDALAIARRDGGHALLDAVFRGEALLEGGLHRDHEAREPGLEWREWREVDPLPRCGGMDRFGLGAQQLVERAAFRVDRAVCRGGQHCR
jgi:hypothetical protein